jgi:hypothetical protein
MAGSNPGFAGFMGGLMNPEPQVPHGKGPPSPMATQGNMPPPNRPGNNMGRVDISMARSSYDGISIKEKHEQLSEPIPIFSSPQKSSRRPDMKGPTDISDILSGLKTKTIEITPQKKDIIIEDINNSSTISLDDLKSIQGEGNVPKRSRRKTKSDKNTISLDI